MYSVFHKKNIHFVYFHQHFLLKYRSMTMTFLASVLQLRLTVQSENGAAARDCIAANENISDMAIADANGIKFSPWGFGHLDTIGENKVVRIAKCDAFSGVCESIRYFRAFECESLIRGNVRVIVSQPCQQSAIAT